MGYKIPTPGGGDDEPTDSELVVLAGDLFDESAFTDYYAVRNLPVQTDATTARTLTFLDAQYLTLFSGASAVTLTVPADATEDVPVGSQYHYAQYGIGQVSFVGASGVTVVASPSYKTRAQGSVVTLIKLSDNVWLATGDLEPLPVAAGAPVADAQVFTANGTWVKPAGNYRTAQVIVLAAGGGGGSGRRGAAGSIRAGGGGGGGGGWSEAEFLFSELNATEPVTIGAGGAGGAAVAVDDTNGNPGLGGGTTSLGTAVLVRAAGGTAGSGGTASAGAGGAGGTGRFVGGTGGSASATGGVPAAASNQPGPGAGGGGGGITTANAASNGGTGGSTNTRVASIGGGTAGVSPGGAGGAATHPATNSALPGSGGGGGAGHAAGVGGTGGAGTGPGGGGGGGGASVNGNNSGAGGAGAGGIVMVICR